MAVTALMKYFLKGDCGDHVKAGHTERGVSGADQVA
jgi:hypothetical protein